MKSHENLLDLNHHEINFVAMYVRDYVQDTNMDKLESFDLAILIAQLGAYNA